MLYSFVVEQILSGESRETILENIHSKLVEVGEKVQNGEIPVELYHITKVKLSCTDICESLFHAVNQPRVTLTGSGC